MNLSIDVNKSAVGNNRSPSSGMKSPCNSIDEYPAARMKLDELFLHWLSLDDTQKTVRGYLKDIREGKELDFPASPSPRTAGALLSPRSVFCSFIYSIH
jgi:hypothetical protein